MLLFFFFWTTSRTLLSWLFIRLWPTKHRPSSTNIFLKPDSAIDILQEIFYALHKKKSFYEKLYLIFWISSQWLHQPLNFVISFDKNMKNFKKYKTEKLKNGYLPIFFKKLLFHLRCYLVYYFCHFYSILK